MRQELQGQQGQRERQGLQVRRVQQERRVRQVQLVQQAQQEILGRLAPAPQDARVLQERLVQLAAKARRVQQGARDPRVQLEIQVRRAFRV